MGLLSYDPMEDGEVATGNLWNVRLSAIHDLLNGNLDAANLSNEAVTTPKIAQGAVTYEKLVDDIFSDLVQTQANTGTGGGTFNYVNIGGLKLAWGTATSSNTAWKTIDYTNVGFTSPPVLVGSTIEIATPSGYVEWASSATPGSGSPTSASASFLSRIGATNNSTTTIQWFAIGV